MNKRLAIKGHSTRGQEIIKILEMLGGKNYFQMDGFAEEYIHYICKEKDNQIHSAIYRTDQIVFTLEEFLEKFPYKVGDKVTHSDYESPLEIVGMKWKDDSIKYEVYTNDYGYWFIVDELQPYKEETREDNKLLGPNSKLPSKYYEEIQTKRDMDKTMFMLGHTLVPNKMDDKLEYEIIDGYEFDRVDNNKIILKPIKPKYPKTYEECSLINGCDNRISLKIIGEFTKLINARNAYWKIAGEQMGLGKSWEPDWNNLSTTHEFVKINKGCFTYSSRVLVFPTEEMRDTFFENFKDLIEQCKELL